MSSKEEKKGLSRRAFLKNSGLTVAAATAGATLLGPQVAGAQAPVLNSADQAAQKWTFEVAPDPIPDSQIAKTVTGDIVIIGSGVSGITAAAAAVENGAKVVLISASKAPVYRGGSFHATNSRYMKSQNIAPNTEAFFREELACAGFNVDQLKWWKFFNNSPEAVDWLSDKMEAAGFRTALEITNYEPDNGPMNVQPGSHSWLNADNPATGASAGPVTEVLEKFAKDQGVDFHYQTLAKQLVRDDNNTGRVTAVIALETDGTYTKYVGTKAIILATGDFSNNLEMMTKYCPWVIPLLDSTGDQGYDNLMKIGGLMPGDGQKMGLWIGAAWQKTPNAPMVMAMGAAGTQPYGAHRGLMLNSDGLRYGNEDVNGPFAGYASMHQPGMLGFAIWGTNYAVDAAPWHSFGQEYGADPVDPADILAGWQASAKAGNLIAGDTIEEVIQKLGLPADATQATIDRYNGFAATGIDEDYHKRAALLVPIKDAPFYGSAFGKPAFLTVLGGLRTNENLQVCDANDQAIPGLYNIGTMVGDYFANVYNFRVEGNNLGANCMTFGYMTGRDIAKGVLS